MALLNVSRGFWAPFAWSVSCLEVGFDFVRKSARALSALKTIGGVLAPEKELHVWKPKSMDLWCKTVNPRAGSWISAYFGMTSS